MLFFFNAPATTEIYTLSLHDALPIWVIVVENRHANVSFPEDLFRGAFDQRWGDRKSTRLNSSHTVISYAVFCLKKKKKKTNNNPIRDTPKHNKEVNSKLDNPHIYNRS